MDAWLSLTITRGDGLPALATIPAFFFAQSISVCDNLNDAGILCKTPGETAMEEDKKRALSAALGQIERQFGKGAIMRLGDTSAVRDIDVISTGSLNLDVALGIGGLPRGRVVEIYGPESSGKTTLTLEVIAQAQKAGGTAAFIDAEHALDPKYAAKIGVNVDELLVSQPDTGEQALEIADMVVRSGAVDVVVIDSVAALVPKAELEGDMGDTHVGLQARLMSQALRKLTSNIKRSNTLVIFINQIRMKIGVMFGSPETTSGGNALKFYASVRLDIRRIGAIKRGDEVVGNETRVKVVKNKVAPPFRQVEFDILYGEGFSREGELLDLGVANNLVDKAGAWYSYNGERIGQGRDNVREFLKQNPEMAASIDVALREKLMPKPEPRDAADAVEAEEIPA
ncbi:MAG: recombination protein RecA [Gammaproteobacteria bacterium]